ncbi:MAG: hypothetical protein OIN85_04225 [Candidatus Methanoperedens sp.]|nr:hypothetical protein [Candidatus Methanoperedens sp.]
MDTTSDFTIHNGKLTILAAFGHGGELDKTQLKMLIGGEVIAERWNKPIEIEKAEGVAVIAAGSEKITCNTNMFTDIFAAGVSILRTEIEIRDKISLNDILTALHSNTIIVEGLDYQSYANKRIKEIREKINPKKTVAYYPDIKKFTFLKIKDFTPQLDQKSLREQYGEIIARFLSGETPTRALHSKEIMEKTANDLSYYDEDLFLASTEAAFVIGCDGYINELRELLELAISLLLLFQIYDRKIDVEISNAFDALKKLNSSRYYFITQAPRKLEKSLFTVSEIGLVILDDIKDLMNPHKITNDWYYQSFYQNMLDTLKVRDFGKLVQEKIDSLQDLYSTARELATEQLALWLEIVIVLLILWDVIKPIILALINQNFTLL